MLVLIFILVLVLVLAIHTVHFKVHPLQVLTSEISQHQNQPIFNSYLSLPTSGGLVYKGEGKKKANSREIGRVIDDH